MNHVTTEYPDKIYFHYHEIGYEKADQDKKVN